MSHSALFKQIGRLTFLLSSAFVAAVCGGAQVLLQAHPDNERVSAAVKVGLILVGVFWIRSLERRLLDAGLPRWCFWPYFLAVFTACAGLHARGILDVPDTLAFFVVVQIPTALFPSKPQSPASAMQRSAPGELFPEYNKPVGRFQFVLRVSLIAALYAGLLELARGAGPGFTAWEMRLGIVLFAFVWIYSVEGRAMDAGLPRWVSIPYCLIVPGVCVLPHVLKFTDIHVALAMFAVLQFPTILLKSRPDDAVPVLLDAGVQRESSPAAAEKSEPVRPGTRLGSFEFAVYLVLIAGLWHVLHLLRGDAGAGPMAWAVDSGVDAGAFCLGVFWVNNMRGRFRDAGLLRWAIDCCLIVFTASALPLAFNVMSFSQALILFAALQIPVVFIRRGAIPARLLPADADS